MMPDPHPDGAGPARLWPLRRDAGCARCGYNLRGLVRTGACPECGRPVAESVPAGAFAPPPLPTFADVDPWVHAACLATAMDAGIPVQALMFVYTAVTDGAGTGVPDVGPGDHVSAADVCDKCRRLAVARFGSAAAAADALERWGLVAERDVGRAVYALVDAGHVEASDGDRLDDFAPDVRLFPLGHGSDRGV